MENSREQERRTPGHGVRTSNVVFDETLRISHGDSSFENVLARAFKFHQAGKSVRVVLDPGVYRSRFAAGLAESVASLLIEAREPGRTVIRGSDILSGWTASEGLWQASWPHQWGLGNAPDTYGDPYLETPELMRRREMIFVNGLLYRQVMDRSLLEPGRFLVDEANRRILLSPAEHVSPTEAKVEVGMRSGLLDISGRNGVTLRGLRFEHDASFYFTPQRGAVQFSNCTDLLIEDCLFQWNNTKGLQITGAGSEKVALRRVAANHNGCLGILASRIHDLRLEDCETNFNNWRGAWAGKYRGSPCGIKVMRSRGVTLRRHQAIRNLATGIWIDEENRDVCIQDSTVYGNYRGIHLEAGGGPIVVERTTVCANRQEPVSSEFRWAFGSGIAITHIPDVTLRSNFIADNDIAQIGVRDDREKRVISDDETGEKRSWRAERLVLENNTVVASGARNHLLHVPDRDFDSGVFRNSLRATGNHYVRAAGSGGFSVGPEGETLGIVEWRKFTGQDEDSTYERI